ncbi:type II secretion system protein GspH [Aliidiomarina halalkaliphila]|uniref:Type II secretion system protein H n=1 Tax=Aliidiomarina halalkaliphila TaxID=2593535 RepID=A0A552X5N3_9GAMM|nr:GspH/FimT family pseudopilin [Aliidiomarina halalkaliphila]TRW50312.1 type II secretion system protein GspH [Aliidiomarina halalkaliphila]
MNHTGRIQAQRTSGFTLIEVMLLIVILSVASMYIILTIPTRVLSDSAQDASEKFVLQMHHAREQAMLRNHVYGIEFKDDKYTFYRWHNENWVELVQPPLVETRVSEHVDLDFEPGDFRILDNMTEGRDTVFGRDVRRASSDDEEPPRPNVLIFESTEFVPFRLRFTAHDPNERSFVIDGRSGIQIEREEVEGWQ